MAEASASSTSVKEIFSDYYNIFNTMICYKTVTAKSRVSINANFLKVFQRL